MTFKDPAIVAVLRYKTYVILSKASKDKQGTLVIFLIF